MNTLHKITTALLAFALTHSPLVSSKAQAQTPPDAWKCTDLIKGSWTYGSAASACNVEAFQTAASTKLQYDRVLYRDLNTGTAERSRYMSAMFPSMRDLGTYYIKRRNPNVSAAEIAGFLQGFYTLMRQETLWTHYRAGTDSITRYLRGDIGLHSHGIMQIYDTAHYVNVAAGKGADLVGNVLYGLDIFYKNWEASKTASCITSATDYKSRARSAWAAYNGGSGSICRWANPSSPYASHDVAFLQNYEEKSWLTMVSDVNAASAIDTFCLAEGTRPCPAPAMTVTNYYKTTDGYYCLLKNTTLQCVSSARDAQCLGAGEGVHLESPAAMDLATEKQYTRQNLDRHSLCKVNVKGLFSVASVIKLSRTMYLRSTAGGTATTTVPAGTTVQILDFEVTNGETQERYYKVKNGTSVGYVLGGKIDNYGTYAVTQSPTYLTAANAIPGLVRVGKVVKVVNAAGINLRKTVDGELLKTVPVNAYLMVDGIAVKGSDNTLYYKASYGGSYGYVATGHLIPSNTIPSWTVPKTTY